MKVYFWGTVFGYIWIYLKWTSPRWHPVLNSWLIHHQSTNWTIVLTSIKGIQSLSFYGLVFGQKPLMMCFSGLSMISDIFSLLKILFSFSNHIHLWNHMVFYYMGSQSTMTLGIKSTLFTLCLCMKLILAHYIYIWYFIVYTSYGCFFEGAPLMIQ